MHAPNWSTLFPPCCPQAALWFLPIYIFYPTRDSHSPQFQHKVLGKMTSFTIGFCNFLSCREVLDFSFIGKFNLSFWLIYLDPGTQAFPVSPSCWLSPEKKALMLFCQFKFQFDHLLTFLFWASYSCSLCFSRGLSGAHGW